MNPLGIQGLSFLELGSPTPSAIEALLVSLGFSRTHEHTEREVDLYTQHEIRFLLTREHGTHAHGFAAAHGPSINAIGLRVENAILAQEIAVRLGANEAPHGLGTSIDAPAVAGIGGTLVYFVDAPIEDALVAHRDPIFVRPKGLLAVDYVTYNVHWGALERTAQYFREIFGFDGALRAPCGTFGLSLDEGEPVGVRDIVLFSEARAPVLFDLEYPRAHAPGFAGDHEAA